MILPNPVWRHFQQTQILTFADLNKRTTVFWGREVKNKRTRNYFQVQTHLEVYSPHFILFITYELALGKPFQPNVMLHSSPGTLTEGQGSVQLTASLRLLVFIRSFPLQKGFLL
jgi:hypothetical protein